MPERSIRDARDRWAAQYDADTDDTRDLNAKVFQKQAFIEEYDAVLEPGCGTGLNTEWLAVQEMSGWKVMKSPGC